MFAGRQKRMALSHCGVRRLRHQQRFPALPPHDRPGKGPQGNLHRTQGTAALAVYDNAIRRQLFREKRLKNIMGAALQNRDFQVYLQPKYRTESETIGGAEALVRWMGAEGMIYPDEFISLFEKNGFIISWTFGCSKSFASASGRGSTPGCPR